MSACTAPSSVSPGQFPFPTPTSVYGNLRAAFSIPDRSARLQAVLKGVEALLEEVWISDLDDGQASLRIADMAASAGNLVFGDLTIVRRRGTTAVVSLPDGLGIFLFELNGPRGAAPLQISPWNVGIKTLDVIWLESDAGVSYITLGGDSHTRAHFARVARADQTWTLAWSSEETPDWWFNARDASLDISSDLSSITATGQALGTTSIFIEQADAPLRLFRVQWMYADGSYSLTPPMGAGEQRREWLWRVALPSPYTALVEFIERIRVQDRQGASALVASADPLRAALDFGLDLPGGQFRVTAYDEQHITFQGAPGAFVATFQPPQGSSGQWLITDLRPLGAVSPTATPAAP